MSELTKEEVATWIRNIIPYVENPTILSPKGCFKESQDVRPGKIIEYDATLMPRAPEIITQTENLKLLIDLYKGVSQ